MHVAVPSAVLPILLRSTNKDVEVRTSPCICINTETFASFLRVEVLVQLLVQLPLMVFEAILVHSGL